MSKQLIYRAAVLAASAFLASCASAPNGQYVPPEALAKPVTDLAEGIATFGDKVQKETLAGYRRSAREDLMKGAVYTYFRDSDWKKKPLATPLHVLICKPRYGYLRISGPLQNTIARGNSVKDLTKAPSDSLGELFKALGDKYAVDPTLVSTSDDYSTWEANDGKECISQVKNADPFTTRSYVGQESAGVVAAGISLFQTIWDVVKPALTSGLQNIDREKRNTAVQRYFADPKNVTAMKDDLQHVEGFLSKEFDLAQRRAAGEAVVQYIAFKNPSGEHWKKAIAAANESGCASAIKQLNQPPADNEVGITCLNKVFEALVPAMSKTLDAADKLDAELDKTLPKDKLSDQIDTVAKIARGEAPTEVQAKALWGALTRYASLYGTVKDVGSDANKKKIKDGLDALKKAMD